MRTTCEVHVRSIIITHLTPNVGDVPPIAAKVQPRSRQGPATISRQNQLESPKARDEAPQTSMRLGIGEGFTALQTTIEGLGTVVRFPSGVRDEARPRLIFSENKSS